MVVSAAGMSSGVISHQEPTSSFNQPILSLPLHFPLSSFAGESITFDYSLLNNILTEPMMLSSTDLTHVSLPYTSQHSTSTIAPLLMSTGQQSNQLMLFDQDYYPHDQSMLQRPVEDSDLKQDPTLPPTPLSTLSHHSQYQFEIPLEHQQSSQQQPLHTYTQSTLDTTVNGFSTLPPLRQTSHSTYNSITSPYNYTESFYHLVSWVKERMNKSEIIRICRALASFRPSFTALILNLTEEDLVFMEKCFQRTLLKYEKLIVYSGTPTVVWRRTGEIALVGKEFSLITGWTRDKIGMGGANNINNTTRPWSFFASTPSPSSSSSTTTTPPPHSTSTYELNSNKKTYIYELMDAQSALTYWEQFSMIAFDNSQSSVVTTCVLVTPLGDTIRCAFCFTVKKDIFDIPLAIIGNFLPILS